MGVCVASSSSSWSWWSFSLVLAVAKFEGAEVEGAETGSEIGAEAVVASASASGGEVGMEAEVEAEAEDAMGVEFDVEAESGSEVAGEVETESACCSRAAATAPSCRDAEPFALTPDSGGWRNGDVVAEIDSLALLSTLLSRTSRAVRGALRPASVLFAWGLARARAAMRFSAFSSAARCATCSSGWT